MTLAPDATRMARLYALVPCAGIGERAGAGGPKQYITLGGAALVSHTLRALGQVTRLTSTLVVLAPGDDAFAAHAPDYRGWVSCSGGLHRAQSVANGLEDLIGFGATPNDWVLVHDAARCLVRPEWIDALIDACLNDPIGGLLALPVADTLKAEQAGRVAATLDRHAKWQAQTPQMFRLGLLRDALMRTGPQVTDEAGAIEALGLEPKLVVGALENFKVTWPADVELAERLLRTRS